MSDNLWQGISPKLIGHCTKCGAVGLKRNMTALYAKNAQTVTPLIFCHLCPGCFAQLLDDFGVAGPKGG